MIMGDVAQEGEAPPSLPLKGKEKGDRWESAGRGALAVASDAAVGRRECAVQRRPGATARAREAVDTAAPIGAAASVHGKSLKSPLFVCLFFDPFELRVAPNKLFSSPPGCLKFLLGPSRKTGRRGPP